MKVEWCAEDIKKRKRPLIVGKRGRKEQWLVGYLGNSSDPKRYCLISNSDGLIIGPYTAEELAKNLNRDGDQPIQVLELINA